MCNFEQFKELPYIGYTYSKNKRFINHIFQTIELFNQRGKNVKIPYFKQAILLSLQTNFKQIKKFMLEIGSVSISSFKDLELHLRDFRRNKYNIYAGIILKIYNEIMLKYFIQKDLEILQNVNVRDVLNREKYLTLNYIHVIKGREVIGTIYPNGLNMVPGGGGSGLKGLIVDIPLFDVVALVSLGLKISEISKYLSKAYGTIYSEDLISKRIIDIWGSLKNLQDLVLKPVVESLIKDLNDYSLKEISETLKRCVVTLATQIKGWYEGAQFNELKLLIKHNKLDWSRVSGYIHDSRKNLKGYTVDDWVGWIVDESITQLDIAKKVGYNSRTFVVNLIPKISHTLTGISGLSYDDTRRILRKSIIKERLRKGVSPEEILGSDFNYKSIYRESGTIRLDRVEQFFETIFSDEKLSYDQIIDKYYLRSDSNDVFLGKK